MTRLAALRDDDVQSLGRRMQSGSGPLWELTNNIARAIHESRYRTRDWDHVRTEDQWLAVGTWRQAEAVVRVLPFAVVKP